MTLKSLHFVFTYDRENYGLMYSYLKSLGVTIDSSKGIKARNFLIQKEAAKLLQSEGLIDDPSLEVQYRSKAEEAIAEVEEAKRRCDEFFREEIKELRRGLDATKG